jgi:hypothetical protein
MSFLLSLIFSHQQNWRTKGWKQRVFGSEVTQAMYSHMGKCKNDKIKKLKINIFLKKKKFCLVQLPNSLLGNKLFCIFDPHLRSMLRVNLFQELFGCEFSL